MTAHILVLNFNGQKILEKYLPSFGRALVKSRHRCRLSVVDNKSSDGSVEFLKTNFPWVNIYAAKENKVLCSYNDAAGAVDDEILILMNNDIEVDEDFIDALIEPFVQHSDVFFVTPRCLSLDGKKYEGNKTKGLIRYGIYWSSALYPGYEKDIDRPGLTLQGGFGAVDRKKFLELGGYDDLYLPGRLEDADLCFRAYKKGWRCLYEPKSVVYHEGGVSFHKVFGVKETLIINARNTFLFMWKNLSGKRYWLEFFFWLPWRLLYSLVSLRLALFLGFFRALPLAGEAMGRRRILKQAGLLSAVSDRKIFGQII